MASTSTKRRPLVEWGVAGRPRPDETAGGDLYVVRAFPNATLVAIIDGGGSADEAAVAAKTAAVTLRRYGREPLTSLMKRCDRNLVATRGAALALASFSSREDKLSWLGVGNLEGRLLHAAPATLPARERLRSYSGVAGYLVPVVQESSVPLKPGDTLILASDGLGKDFDQNLDLRLPPQTLAEDILERSYIGTDDALVLVARYAGRNHEYQSG